MSSFIMVASWRVVANPQERGATLPGWNLSKLSPKNRETEHDCKSSEWIYRTCFSNPGMGPLAAVFWPTEYARSAIVRSEG